MSEQQIFVLSEKALAKVIAQIRPEHWDQPKPTWFETGAQGDVSLRSIVNYHSYDSAWVPDVLAGKTMAEVGDIYEHLKTDTTTDYQAHSDAAVAAALALDDPNKVVHLSYGEFPAREYLKHVTSFRGFRSYDIAKWIGVDTQMPADLVHGMWDELSPEIDAWREMGVYGPAVEVPQGAPLQDRLLGLVGRDPSAALSPDKAR